MANRHSYGGRLGARQKDDLFVRTSMKDYKEEQQASVLNLRSRRLHKRNHQ